MNAFLAGDQMLLAHGPQVLRLPEPAFDSYDGESSDIIANYNGGFIRQVVKIPVAMWYALQLRVKILHLTATISGSWSADRDLSLPGHPADPGQLISGDIEYDLPFYRTGPESHGLAFTGEPPFGFHDPLSKGEFDIIGPNRDWDDFEANPGAYNNLGLLPWRGLQNNGFAEKLETPTVTVVDGIPDGLGSIFTGFVFARLRLGATRPSRLFAPVVVGPPAGDYFDKVTNEVFMPVDFSFAAGIDSSLRGFSCNAIPAGVPGAPAVPLGSAGSITLRITGFPDLEIPLIFTFANILYPFHLLSGIHRSLAILGTLEATEFWEYENSQGLPVYDSDTGAELRDPLS